MAFLDEKAFAQVIENSPLISLDLIVENEKGQILLGQRNNRPAQGWWFVPGGRILKNERLNSAFGRLTLDELGVSMDRDRARLLDIYEHFYSDSVFGDNPSTHYVVAGYHIKLSESELNLPVGIQHAKYSWFDVENMTLENSVHQHSIDYLTRLFSKR